MKEEVTKSKNLGLTGKGVIHPKQIKVLNQVFTLSLQEVKKAKKIIDLFTQSSSGLVLYKGANPKTNIKRNVKNYQYL